MQYLSWVLILSVTLFSTMLSVPGSAKDGTLKPDERQKQLDALIQELNIPDVLEDKDWQQEMEAARRHKVQVAKERADKARQELQAERNKKAQQQAVQPNKFISQHQANIGSQSKTKDKPTQPNTFIGQHRANTGYQPKTNNAHQPIQEPKTTRESTPWWKPKKPVDLP